MGINVTADMSGLEDLERKLKELHGIHTVPLAELMPDDFIRRNTDFATLSEMLDASGLTLESQEDFESGAWNAFVAERTRFENWKEMQQAAAGEWVGRKLE
jgi:hypothetical protein